MIEYLWARDFKQAHVIFQERHVLDLVLFGRAAYLFNRKGGFKRFPSEEAARAWISERAEWVPEAKAAA